MISYSDNEHQDNGTKTEFPADDKDHDQEKIISGQQTGVFASTVFLVPKSATRISCSGVLIAPNLLITAYHCVAAQNEMSNNRRVNGVFFSDDLSVGIGSDPIHGTNGAGFKSRSQWVAPYPGTTAYTAAQWDSINYEMASIDLAMVTIDPPIAVASYPTISSTPLASGSLVVLAGYGAYTEGVSSYGQVYFTNSGVARYAYANTTHLTHDDNPDNRATVAYWVRQNSASSTYPTTGMGIQYDGGDAPGDSGSAVWESASTYYSVTTIKAFVSGAFFPQNQNPGTYVARGPWAFLVKPWIESANDIFNAQPTAQVVNSAVLYPTR